MRLENLHTHTVFSDGENTPEEMAEAAVSLGFSALGFSDHSFTGFDPDYCMTPESYEAYKKEIRRLKEAYAGRLEIRLGIEQDLYSDLPAEGFDYVIGSVHYLKLRDEYVCADWGGEYGARILKDAAERFFGGDIYKVLECYFEAVSGIPERTGADIIGHFDVIRKANEVSPFFDPSNPRYRAAWKKAADILLRSGKPFEINVSQVLKGTLSEPYPSKEICSYLASEGAAFLYTGDTHSVSALQSFAEYLQNRESVLK